MMLAVCCPMLPRHSSWRLQVGQHLALPPPCSSWAKLPCPAFSDCLGLGAEAWPGDLQVGEDPWDVQLSSFVVISASVCPTPCAHTIPHGGGSWQVLRHIAGSRSHGTSYTSPGCMQEKPGQIQRCHGAPPAAPQSVSLGLLGRFVQRPQLLVPGFCAAVSAGRCHAGCIKYL